LIITFIFPEGAVGERGKSSRPLRNDYSSSLRRLRSPAPARHVVTLPNGAPYVVMEYL
jgi:hypothetical protein